MKKILFICPYPVNTIPGQRLKYEQYFKFLKITITPALLDRFLILKSMKYSF